MQFRKFVLVLFSLLPAQALACEKFSSLRDADWRLHAGDDPAWAAPGLDDRQWKKTSLPSKHSDLEGGPDNGFVWYRLRFNLARPQTLHPCYLLLGRVQEVDEVYLNGKRIGGTGKIGPNWFDYVSGARKSRAYALPHRLLRPGGENVLAVRAFSVALMPGIVSGDAGLGPPDIVLGKAFAADRWMLDFEVITITLLVFAALLVAFLSFTRHGERRFWLLLGIVVVVLVNYAVDASLVYPLRLEAPWLKRLIFLFVPALPILIAAYLARVTRRPMSRWIEALALLPIPVAALYLFNIPIETAVRMYDFWYLSFLPIAIALLVYAARRARFAIRNLALLRVSGIVLVLALLYEQLNPDLLPADLDVTEIGVLIMAAAFMIAFARRIAQDNLARKRLAAGVLSAQDEERRRIARELHDGLGQRLVAARLLLEAEALHRPGGMLEDVVRELRDTTRDLRGIVHGLRPVELGDVDLKSALVSYAHRMKELTTVDVDVVIDDEAAISGAIEEHLFRICQEAVNNAIRHGRAERVTIILSRERGGLDLKIRDDGEGFDLRATGMSGLGLTAMSERVRLCNGHFDLQSAPGEGTTIRVNIPLTPSAEKPTKRVLSP